MYFCTAIIGKEIEWVCVKVGFFIRIIIVRPVALWTTLLRISGGNDTEKKEKKRRGIYTHKKKKRETVHVAVFFSSPPVSNR